MPSTFKALIKSSALASLEKAGSVWPNRHGLKIRWFDSWHPVLDDALKTIPEAESCPHELFKLLASNPCAVRKRIVLFTKAGIPVAVVGLRQAGTGSHQWALVTEWITPGFLFPVKPGFSLPVFESIGVEVSVAWWRMPTAPPASKLIRSLTSTPTHRMSLPGNPEAYWRASGYFRHIANARNHCLNFPVALNPPGATEWIIESAERKWRQDRNRVDPTLSDRIVSARFMQERKLACTIALLDEGVPVAASVNYVHGTSLVGGVIYRKPEYDRHKVGIRIIDAAFCYAAESGFAEFDIGGGYDYKVKWAPPAGARAYFQICPEIIFQGKRLLARLRKTTVPAHSHETQAP